MDQRRELALKCVMSTILQTFLRFLVNGLTLRTRRSFQITGTECASMRFFQMGTSWVCTIAKALVVTQTSVVVTIGGLRCAYGASRMWTPDVCETCLYCVVQESIATFGTGFVLPVRWRYSNWFTRSLLLGSWVWLVLPRPRRRTYVALFKIWWLPKTKFPEHAASWFAQLGVIWASTEWSRFILCGRAKQQDSLWAAKIERRCVTFRILIFYGALYRRDGGRAALYRSHRTAEMKFLILAFGAFSWTAQSGPVSRLSFPRLDRHCKGHGALLQVF